MRGRGSPPHWVAARLLAYMLTFSRSSSRWEDEAGKAIKRTRRPVNGVHLALHVCVCVYCNGDSVDVILCSSIYSRRPPTDRSSGKGLQQCPNALTKTSSTRRSFLDTAAGVPVGYDFRAAVRPSFNSAAIPSRYPVRPLGILWEYVQRIYNLPAIILWS